MNIAAKLQRRKEILGITDWLFDQCQRLGVVFRFNTYADIDMVIELSPEVVLIATGGVPHAGYLKTGADLAVSSWIFCQVMSLSAVMFYFLTITANMRE